MEKSSRERTEPLGAPVLMCQVLDMMLLSLIWCLLSVRKLVIQLVDGGTLSWVSFQWRITWCTQIGSSSMPLGVEGIQDEVQCYVACIIQQPVYQVSKLQGVQLGGCPPGGSITVVQRISSPQISGQKACSHLIQWWGASWGLGWWWSAWSRMAHYKDWFSILNEF